MTCGTKCVSFCTYDIDRAEITPFAPTFSEVNLNISETHFTCCAFHPTYRHAIAGTDSGELVVFEGEISGKPGVKSAVKHIKIHQCGLSFLCILKEQFIVVGTIDGAIKIFDEQYRSLFWYTKLNSGAILNITLSHSDERTN